MIEEAAGTRMYESKKLSAQKTIEKKESKLKEIETVTIFYINYKGFEIEKEYGLHGYCLHIYLNCLKWHL
jgi:hypothetical protein